MKIIFIGTPEFGAIILNELIEENFKPNLVITAPDKPVGRKQILTPSPVKVLAERYEIQILQPNKILDSRFQILDSKPDLIVVAAYGQILPKEILEIPKYGCLNVHPSLLPKYRGPSPIQYAILNGDTETGVTIMLMDEKMDHGPIISVISYQLLVISFTYEELSKELANLGAELLIKTIPKWVAGEIKPDPQDESKATYTKIIKKEDGKIDWKKSAEEIERQIRAFNPWPGTFALFGSKNLKILKTEVLKQTKDGPFGELGKTFLAPDDKIAVQTGKEYLVIEELQLEGKREMKTPDFLKGHQNFIGTTLK